MLLIEAKDYNDMSRKAANIISAQVIMKPHAVLGLATGSTPVGAYKQLVEWYNKGDLDFANVTSVNLDEYKGLSPENDQSYRYFMNTNLFNHVNINKESTFVPNGLEPDSEKHVQHTTKSSAASAALICSCSDWETTATSDSTSRAQLSRKRHTAWI